MSKGDVVFVVTGDFRGEHFGPEVFLKRPTGAQLKRLAYKWDGPEEGFVGPGDFGSYVYLIVSARTIK
jgi:hypothetical protein